MTSQDPAPPIDAEVPNLRLLGTPALGRGDHSRPFEPDRAHGLLAYLACRRDWVRRDELAELFYPNRDLEDARSNLRKVIHLARKVHGVGELEQRGDVLRWNPDSDLARFDAACDARNHGEAVALYGGTLLLGLDAAWPHAARDWLDAERARLQSRWHDACVRRLAELRDDPQALRALAETMLRHDPLDDVAVQALARAQHALGRRDEALSAVDDYARRVSDELQLEPSSVMRKLTDDLRGEGPKIGAAAPPSLVGRRHERGLVRERLADPACRVLTLLGPPGVGKSALARSLAEEHAGMFISLEGQSIDDVPGAIAAALGLSPDARLASWEGLAKAIGARPALLLMDNVETLPLAEPLAALLANCAKLRVVATSRSPLLIPGEWRLPIEGLPLPDADERDPEVLRANDAVSLFERRALQLVPSFELGAEAADVVELVHAVEGLPLAIELLAAWRRVMPVRAIVGELASSLDLLESGLPGERSVRAAFDRSWQQLSEREQRVLARLAQLPAPCDREMARVVVPAPLPVLAALVDRSLLRIDEQGAFWLHPLIRRCAAPLADDVDALCERHARHAASVLSRRSGPLAEWLPHALAAWDWGVAHADASVLGVLAQVLDVPDNSVGRWRESIARAKTAATALRRQLALAQAHAPGGTAREAGEALCHVLGMDSQLSYYVGDLDGALASAREMRSLAQEWDLPIPESQSWSREASVQWQRGDYDAAEAGFKRAAGILDAAGKPDWARRTESWLWLIAKARGDYAGALQGYATQLQAFRAEGRLTDNLFLPNNMGNLLRLLGRYDESLALLGEALQIARDNDKPSHIPFLLCNIVLTLETRGDLDEAARRVVEAVAASQEHGEPMIEAASRLALARITARRTRDRKALAEVHAALAIERRIGSSPLRVQCLSTAGVVLAATGDTAFGVGLVRWATTHKDFARSEREDAMRHLAALGLAEETGEVLPRDATADALVARLPLA